VRRLLADRPGTLAACRRAALRHREIHDPRRSVVPEVAGPLRGHPWRDHEHGRRRHRHLTADDPGSPDIAPAPQRRRLPGDGRGHQPGTAALPRTVALPRCCADRHSAPPHRRADPHCALTPAAALRHCRADTRRLSPRGLTCPLAGATPTAASAGSSAGGPSRCRPAGARCARSARPPPRCRARPAAWSRW
jgi:hypothetical protein